MGSGGNETREQFQDDVYANRPIYYQIYSLSYTTRIERSQDYLGHFACITWPNSSDAEQPGLLVPLRDWSCGDRLSFHHVAAVAPGPGRAIVGSRISLCQ